ncbi:hypothetical protein SPBR_09255 [Sporothrix brasiliensis 5110]|uniref:Uncharacterized protein n=1 Tax=Sporothrix brasiliensis 5110 TaxID=1398154 RepID=A0A0C2FW28_9PEZI|nr:uncharacterized protein SPBR_09255 [Sporothrix brasiliensis 5110]KIH95213.1 hypothetical protein SPBR_09255 [Sporothrix brasiliensis 5110]
MTYRSQVSERHRPLSTESGETKADPGLRKMWSLSFAVLAFPPPSADDDTHGQSAVVGVPSVVHTANVEDRANQTLNTAGSPLRRREEPWRMWVETGNQGAEENRHRMGGATPERPPPPANGDTLLKHTTSVDSSFRIEASSDGWRRDEIADRMS